MKRAKRRALLMNSALEVFAQKGYHAASISDIIKHAGVARGTFYLYFEGKRAIFDQLLDETLAALYQRIKRIDPSRGSAGVAAQIEANVDGVLSYLFANKAMLRVLLAEAVGLDSGFDQKLSEFYGQLLDLIRTAISEGKNMKLIEPKIHVAVAALCILGSIKEVLYQQAMGAPLPKQQEILDEVLRYNVQALFVPEVAKKLKY